MNYESLLMSLSFSLKFRNIFLQQCGSSGALSLVRLVGESPSTARAHVLDTPA